MDKKKRKLSICTHQMQTKQQILDWSYFVLAQEADDGGNGQGSQPNHKTAVFHIFISKKRLIDFFEIAHTFRCDICKNNKYCQVDMNHTCLLTFKVTINCRERKSKFDKITFVGRKNAGNENPGDRRN